MQRVLGGDKRRGWEGRLARKIRQHAGKLERFRELDLSSADIGRRRSEIEEVYKDFKKAPGGSGVAAAKALHLICPSFFPPWDNAIATAFKAEGIDPFAPAHYYQFMLAVGRLLRKYEDELRPLAEKFNRSSVKILDQALWMTANNPLFVFVEASKG